MKKFSVLAAFAAVILAGCAKEPGISDAGGVTVDFTAQIEAVTTKAVADGDGNAASVNRCIMEIYYGGELYKRMEAPVTGSSATFSNVPVVAGKQYQILFWADCGEAYYATDATLKAVAVNADAFLAAHAAGENDKLDAFFFSDNYTVPQAGGNYNATLKRPFAQLNVITTDVGEGQTVSAENLLPEKVSVEYTAANVFNVATGEASGSQTYSYEAAVYGDWSTVTDSHKELTLSMDYVLASAEKAMVDVDFKTKNGGTVVMTYSLSNLPYQRNYRTNVKGNLLTTGGTWTATVDPIWSTPDIVKVVEVADIKSANEIISHYASTTTDLEVKFTAEPNDSGVPTGDASSESRAILTTPIQEDATLSIEVLAQTRSLYVGDYPNEYTVANTVPANHAVVNINVPETSSIETLVINAPSKSVYINGKEVANVGTITSLDAITSQNTLIIEKGQTVNKLTIRQGGLEIHGTVATLVIDENAHEANPVKVRTSENLSQTVFDVIYKAGEHDYIDRPDFSEKQNANGTWNIIPSVCKITETGKAYGSVADAFKAVENGQTIVMLQNDILTKGQTITLANNDVFTLDLNGKTISIAETGFDFAANNTKSSNAIRSGIPARFAVVVTGQGTMNICDNSADKLGCFETKDYSYGSTKTILVDGNAVVNVNSGTIASDYASFYVVGYTATGAVPANAPKPTLNVNSGKILSELVGIGIKGNTATLKVTGGEIIGKGYYGISTNGTTDWYDGGKFAIEITGGYIKSEEGAAMYLPAEGPTVITGGTIEGAEGIAVKGGSLSISGDAVVKAHGAYGEPSAASSGYTQTGSCIYVEDTYPDHSPIVSFSGGKFSSDNNKAVEYFTNKADDATNRGKVTLTGGIYSDKSAESFVAEGYSVVENPDAATKAEYPWAVGRKGVAQIGTIIYYDLKDAIDAVPSGTETETMITMLDNVSATATFTIPSDKNICLELNGKSIFASSSTSSQGFPLFANKGIFTVQDKTDTRKDGTGTGKLSTIAYDPDMRPVPGYATNTITNYGTLNIKSGLVESGSNGMASYAIDNEAENAQYHNSSNKTITLNVSGGRIISGQSNSIRMYLATSGQYDNVINIDNAYIGSLWVQDNYGATAAKGSLTISNSTFDHNLSVGYECYSEHFSLNVSNSTFGGKVHYQLDSEAEGNTISIDNISAKPFFMDYSKKVLHNGTVTIKGEFPYGWVYAKDDAAKAELEAAGWRLEDVGQAPWYQGYLKEEGILNYLNDCIEDGYQAVCVDQAAGKYEIRPVQN